MVEQLLEDIPEAVLLDSRIDALESVTEVLREDKRLSSMLLLLLVREPDPALLADAFRWGVDDFLVVGAEHQFRALVAGIERTDNWSALRAPAGQVLLAHDDRLERVKLARILKRNGYDPTFAGTSEEVATAMDKDTFRAVISSIGLPGKPLFDVMIAIASKQGYTPPWIVISPSEDIESNQKAAPSSISTFFFESGADPEGITFILNEILAPPPVGARRSQRVLYGTPISFIHKGGEQAFHGFTFDINLGGVYIRTLTPLPLQTKITVRFRPPFGRGSVVADAQVVWRKEYGETSGRASPPGMGVQFLDMYRADRAAYEAGYQHLVGQSQHLTITQTPPSDL